MGVRLMNQHLWPRIFCVVLIVVSGSVVCGESEKDTPGPSTRAHKPRELEPSLKFKTLEAFEKEIKEPAVLLNSEHVCFFAPQRKEKQARLVFRYLIRAYDELYRIVGVHTEYKVAVYAFPKGNPHGWGGTSNCSIEYDDSNLDFNQFPEWKKHRKPHLSGYIEEMAHNFVRATKAQFGWEMIGWSIGIKVAKKVAGNPLLSEHVRNTRKEQKKTVRRYIANRFVFPKDIPGNKVDRIHAWILWRCERAYGPSFWRDFFQEIRKERKALKDALHLKGADARQNKRYQITVECFDRLPGVNFKKRLQRLNISLKTDIMSLHPEKAHWDRLLRE